MSASKILVAKEMVLRAGHRVGAANQILAQASGTGQQGLDAASQKKRLEYVMDPRMFVGTLSWGGGKGTKNRRRGNRTGKRQKGKGVFENI